MARKKIKEEVPEPNLVPVMNLVMLLIPFLLMASAFFEVAIINVSAPKVASGPSSDDTPKDDKPKLNLTVVVSDAGFKICAYGGCLGPGGVRDPEGGPANGPGAGGAPTVATKKFSHECLDATATPPPAACTLPLLQSCRSDGSSSHDLPYPERRAKGLDPNGGNRKDCNADGKADKDICSGEATDCNYLDFDYAGLRTQLAKLKAGAEQERKVMIMADEAIPFEVVVGVMDAARDMKTESGETKELFPDVVLSPGFQ